MFLRKNLQNCMKLIGQNIGSSQVKKSKEKIFQTKKV